ncbi:MAG: FAD binding domain-containing protein [Planctomycetota bacterium]
MSSRSGLLRRVEVFSPDTPEEVVQLLRDLPAPIQVIAGATSLLVRAQLGRWQPKGVVIDLSCVADLQSFEVGEKLLRIGSTVTCSQMAQLDDRHPLAPIFGEATCFGPLAIRNRATVGGNIMQARATADLATALLALDASIVLLSAEGRRQVPLFSFLVADGETSAKSTELLVEIRIEIPKPPLVTFYRRVARCAAGRSVVSFAGVVTAGEQGPRFRVAVGGAGPTALRLFELERVLAAEPLSEALIPRAIRTLDSEITPPDDFEETAAYRRQLISRLLAEFLELSLKQVS